MGETTSWLSGQFASLIPNVLPATMAAASSSGSGSGSGGCVPVTSTVVSFFCVNTSACGPNNSQVKEWATLVNNCGQTHEAPTATTCCPVVG